MKRHNITKAEQRQLWTLLDAIGVHEALNQVAGYCYGQAIEHSNVHVRRTYNSTARDIDKLLEGGTAP